MKELAYHIGERELLVWILLSFSLAVGCSCLAACQNRKEIDISTLTSADGEAIGLGELISDNADSKRVLFYEHYGAGSAHELRLRFSQSREDIHRETEYLYEKTFTPEELKLMTRFYSTAEGRAIASKQAFIVGQLAVIGQPYAKRMFSIAPQPITVH